jgi:glucokinase
MKSLIAPKSLDAGESSARDYGGIFIGGGIAPKILRKLREGGFMAAFVRKGRSEDLLQHIPVRVILNDKSALLGAARAAAMRASLL